MQRSQINLVNLAVDAMGGDLSIAHRIAACLKFLSKHPNSKITLFGDISQIHKHLNKLKLLYKIDNSKIMVIATNAKTEVKAGDKPELCLKNNRESSMAKTIEMVANNQADAALSCGNSGALVAFTKTIVGMKPNIKLPAFCGRLPSINGDCWMFDLGGVIDNNAERLQQLTKFAASYFIKIYDKKPIVKILNIGEEQGKGVMSTKELTTKIQNIKTIDYKGFIEPNNLLASSCNFIICDGYSGNIALKAMEGSANYVRKNLAKSLKTNFLYKFIAYLMLKFLDKVIARESIFDLVDPRQYGGAFLLGANNLVIKSHGNSDKNAFYSALCLAYKMTINKRPLHKKQ